MAPRGQTARSQASITELARQLATLLKELDLTEIEASIGQLRVRLQRVRAVAAPPAAPGAPVEIAAAAPAADAAAAAKLITIEAPMVGTFYRASSPTAEPYVREGDVVKEGQILCIIEAMKLMNEIESRASGRIVKILVENGQPVEYGQPLVLIDPAG
ncbi:MAG: acetyl-CoA carboxylase biotin carboxyl carrier protein [Candidatus Rokuibacteriota bacterium]